jgi:integrase
MVVSVRAVERFARDAGCDADVKVTKARSGLAAGEAWIGSGLVLTTRCGTPIGPRNFQHVFKARAAKAEIPVIPVHATRRTCASLLIAPEVHPRVVMTILRHSKIAVTMDSAAKCPRRAPGMASSASARSPEKGVQRS